MAGKGKRRKVGKFTDDDGVEKEWLTVALKLNLNSVGWRTMVGLLKRIPGVEDVQRLSLNSPLPNALEQENY